MGTAPKGYHSAMDAGRDKYVAIRRVLVLTLLGNLLVAVLKLVVGSITSSLAMVADGLHSSLDSSSNVVGFIAMSLMITILELSRF